MENVIIFGAGASFNAGIPLLGNFVETMLDLAQRREFRGKILSPKEKSVFERVEEIRAELDSYLARSKFDNDNLEDLLSVLAFNAMSESRLAKKSFSDLSRAVGRTIEICSKVTFDPSSKVVHAGKGDNNFYLKLWDILFKIHSKTGNFPTLISLNYDLVLERSLLHYLSGRHQEEHKLRDFNVNYHHGGCHGVSLSIEQKMMRPSETKHGELLSGPIQLPYRTSLPEINYLKLHGSLNFSKQGIESLHEAVDDPEILPPIFNKTSGNNARPAWNQAISALRNAKNVCIVGYSLPKTDIYMQFFLRAALGPNSKLRRVNIFDPQAFEGSALEARYMDCFSDQMRKNIKLWNYQFSQFITLIGDEPEKAFFI